MIGFYVEPPKELYKTIIKRIRKEERLLVLRRTILFSGLLIASIFSIIPSAKILFSDFSQSGFLHFFSLMFSDFSVVTHYWQSFAMILLETLPAASLVLVLTILLVALQSAKSLVKNIKIMANNSPIVAAA